MRPLDHVWIPESLSIFGDSNAHRTRRSWESWERPLCITMHHYANVNTCEYLKSLDGVGCCPRLGNSNSSLMQGNLSETWQTWHPNISQHLRDFNRLQRFVWLFNNEASACQCSFPFDSMNGATGWPVTALPFLHVEFDGSVLYVAWRRTAWHRTALCSAHGDVSSRISFHWGILRFMHNHKTLLRSTHHRPKGWCWQANTCKTNECSMSRRLCGLHGPEHTKPLLNSRLFLRPFWSMPLWPPATRLVVVATRVWQ